MNADTLTREVFLDDIKNHKMKVIKDDGLYRHLHFSDETFSMYFELITWPEHLMITGDMGSYCFTRIEDMFNFFRKDDDYINTEYWAEKCISESVFGNGIREFDCEKFRENVLEYVKDFLELETKEDIPEDIMDEIYYLIHCDNEWECISTMNDFSSSKIEFIDFWENNCMSKTYHFIWCLYAIVWGIKQYDTYKESTCK
jgi:hypothetical protein